MHGTMISRDNVRTRLRREHLARAKECRPLLSKSIPLGRSVYHESYAVQRYYERKAARGIEDKYPGLH